MWLVILFGAIGAVALFEGAVIVGLMFAAGAADENPATVDLEDADVYAIDSAGRAYEAVAVTPCGRCRQTLPTDHQCTGQAVGA